MDDLEREGPEPNTDFGYVDKATLERELVKRENRTVEVLRNAWRYRSKTHPLHPVARIASGRWLLSFFLSGGMLAGALGATLAWMTLQEMRHQTRASQLSVVASHMSVLDELVGDKPHNPHGTEKREVEEWSARSREEVFLALLEMKRELGMRIPALYEGEPDRYDFSRVLLGGAMLSLRDLRHVDFYLTDLRAADLRGCDLRGSNLRRADLRGAKLDGSRLKGAMYSKSTKFPEGFGAEERARRGMVLDDKAKPKPALTWRP